MIKTSRMLMTVLAASVALGALVGSASANRLSVTNQNIRATWNPMEFAASSVGVLVRCPVTLEGSLHSRTITKTSGSLIGYITRAIVQEAQCAGGRARTLQETLPWHVRYRGFTGNLPAINTVTVDVVNASFLILANVLGAEISCLYRTSAATPAIGTFTREAGGTLTSVAVGGSIASSTGFPCPTGTLGGTSRTLTLLGNTTTIRVTLI